MQVQVVGYHNKILLIRGHTTTRCIFLLPPMVLFHYISSPIKDTRRSWWQSVYPPFLFSFSLFAFSCIRIKAQAGLFAGASITTCHR
ncbi:hypothetical protein F4810DRAFT_654340 [Camillea tinctor]|nr:hypothetical protein F4810DRAFT_654340 [Camillea tinctor]